ncbi:hypothetical protein ACFL6X_03540 [Candidatus Latescibacterota bacterium]
MSRLRRFLTLVAVAAAIAFVCSEVLPRAATTPLLQVVKSNLDNDIDATAYFYTEMEEYPQWEEAVGQMRRDRDKGRYQ